MCLIKTTVLKNFVKKYYKIFPIFSNVYVYREL